MLPVAISLWGAVSRKSVQPTISTLLKIRLNIIFFISLFFLLRYIFIMHISLLYYNFTMVFFGHFSIHTPQYLHLSWSILDKKLSIVTASFGQFFAHNVHPIHPTSQAFIVTGPFSFDEHAFVIKRGEKLRIDISSSAFPLYVRHTNNKGLFTQQTTTRVADNSVDLEHSYIELPISV